MNSPEIHISVSSKTQHEITLQGVYIVESIKAQLTGVLEVYFNESGIIIKNGDTILSRKEFVLKATDTEKCSFFIQNVTIGIDFHWEQQETQHFQGDLKFSIDKGKVNAINILPAEKYLVSVISSEMRADASLELLKTHAVISRSWLFAQIEKQKRLEKSKANYRASDENTDEVIRWYDREDHTGFHVCADDHCQRYQGITRAQNKNVEKAVMDTAGEVLVYENEICDARFSKCCGGVSELFENCWEPVNHPYLTKVEDFIPATELQEKDLTVEANAIRFIESSPNVFCNTTDSRILGQVLNDYDLVTKDFFRWEVKYSQQELSRLIKERSGIDFGVVTDLIPMKRGVSGRLVKLKIVGTQKTMVVGKELEIRKWLSSSHLYSSAFYVEKKNEEGKVTFILKGAGWGHGVGLCQIGAAVMGDKGYGYKDILRHYFKGAELKRWY